MPCALFLYLLSHEEASAFIMQELNEVCGIDRFENAVEDAEPQLALYTAEFRFRAVMDAQRKALSIIGLTQFSFSPRGTPEGGRMATIVAVCAGRIPGRRRGHGLARRRVRGFPDPENDQKEFQAESELFDRWSALFERRRRSKTIAKSPSGIPR